MEKDQSTVKAIKKSPRPTTDGNSNRKSLKLGNLTIDDTIAPRVLSGVVKLNVGGVNYTTSFETLISKDRSLPNFFDLLLNGDIPTTKDDNGAYFIDRDGITFRVILNYLRSGKLYLTNDTTYELVKMESKFYLIDIPYSSIPKFEILKLIQNNVTLKLYGIKIQHTNFTSMFLESAIFKDSILKDCTFDHADLSYAAFYNCNLSGSSFVSSNCMSIHFDTSCLDHTNFNNSSLVEAKFLNTSAVEATLSSCDMTRVHVGKSILKMCIITNCTFKSGSLSLSNLSSSDFTDSNFDGAKFNEVILDDTKLVKICAFRTSFSDCSMVGADLSEADLQQASLSHTNLSKSILVCANFFKANCTSVTLKEATLQNANFSGSILSYATFKYAKLHGCQLDGADLSNADARYCDLSVAIITSSTRVNGLKRV